MNPQDSKQFSAVLTATMDLYGKSLNAMTLRLWFEVLQPYELTDVQRALAMHLSDPNTGQFPPKPADVVKHLTGNRQTLELEAAVAWAKTSGAMSRIGGYASVAFDDPAIHFAVEAMGGWMKLTGGLEAELPFRAREFERLYLAFRTAPGGFSYPAHLVGRDETERNAKGMLDKWPVTPRLVGEERSVRLVMGQGRIGATTPHPQSMEDVLALIPSQLGAS